MAIFVRQFLESARHLDREDWVGLIEYRHRLSLQNDGFRLLGLRTLLADMMSSPIGSLLEGIVYREVNRRLCIAACALERNRLAGHEFPDTLADLPKALLPEVPLDLDKQPIRYHPTPAGFVIWSVGLNLKDDWHGDRPPDAPKSDREPKPRDILDWQWRVP